MRSRRSGDGSTVGALETVLRGPLRRAQISFAAMWAGESAFMVAVAVVAFGGGGVAAVGAVTAIRMAIAALLAPLLATLADRVRRERVLIGIGLVRAAMLAGAAVATGTGRPLGATYGCAVVATAALGLYRPAHSALLPVLAHSPGDLNAANAVRGMLDSGATLGGPLMAAALLAVSGPSLVFAACSALSLLAALVVVALPYDAPPRTTARSTTARRSAGRAVLAGFRIIAGDPRLRLITGLGFAQTVTRGCLTVFTVVIAIDLLHDGSPGVGVLNCAVGAGGVLGSLGAFALVRRGGLASWFGIGVAAFGAPLALIGALPYRVSAIVLLGLVGVGNALIDVGGFTILARLTEETVLARMFADFEAILTLGVAIGGLVAPTAIHLLGTRAALVAVGLLAPAAVVAGRAALRRLDGDLQVRTADIELLRLVPMLAALPASTIEQLGVGLEHAQFSPGQVVFEQGDRGDAFYVVESGLAEVVLDRHLVNTLDRGAGFGEIALLNDGPRTATVRASSGAPLVVAVLARPAFLTAVTGYPMSATTGQQLVARFRADDAAQLEAVMEEGADAGRDGGDPGGHSR